MIYLSGGIPRDLPREIGLMLTQHKANKPQPDQMWAADNGCFTQPEAYSDEAYLGWLAKMLPYRAQCLFATAPDVVGDAVLTLKRSLPVLHKIRDAGYPAALIGQDGMTPDDVPWSMVDCIFLGGTTEWKLSESAAALARAAKQRGLWVHMGRVNSTRRMLIAKRMGCDSVDGTALVFRPTQRLADIQRGIAVTKAQLVMAEAAS